MVRALCARLKSVIAVSAPRAGNFSLLVQREVTKRKHARRRRNLPALLADPRRAPQLAGRWETRLGLEHEARDCSGDRLRCSAAATGLKRTPVPGIEVGCSPPRSARRVPQPEREHLSEPLFESSRVFRGRRVGERPLGRGTEGTGVAGARSGVCFFWLLFFAQAKKSNLPWVSHPQVCVAAGDTKPAALTIAPHLSRIPPLRE